MKDPSNRSPSFQPHFIDVIIARVERFSISYWLFYILLFFITGLVFIVSGWVQGHLEVGIVDVSFLVLGTWIAENLFINHFLVSSSISSLIEFKDQLKINSSDYEALNYSISHIPRFQANLWSMVGLLIGGGAIFYMARANFSIIDNYPLPYLYIAASIGASFWFAGGYRAARQLKIISQLFDVIENINLRDLSSIYGLALFPAKVVLVVILFLYVNPALLLFPEMLSDPVILILWGFLTLSSLAIAILPLRGINQRLSEEKDQLMKENGLRLNLAKEALYTQIDNGDQNKLDKLECGINALLALQRDIQTISTWPWKSETVRWLATALILPLGLLTIQFFLQGLFSS